jgi:WD40 repeat protein
VEGDKRLKTFQEGHEFLATSGEFFADGLRLATGAGDNTVRIWEVASGTQISSLAPTGRIGALAVSPDGDWLVTGSPGHDATLWDSHSGQAMATLSGHEAEVSAVAFAPQGGLLATGDDRGRIRLWRRQGPSTEWTLAHELSGHRGTITGLRFTPAGDTLVSSSGDLTCGQWDVATGQEKRELVLKHPEYVSSLDLSADGGLAITTCDDGVVRLWRLADASVVRTLKSPQGAFNSVAFSPDGRMAVVTSAADREVRLWNLAAADGAEAQATEMLLDFNELGGDVWSATFDRGGNDAQLWSISTRRPVVQFSPHGAVASAEISPDGRLLVTGSWDRSAKIWDVATGRAVRKLAGGHDGAINTAEFSPDGREVLTASDDFTARAWAVESGQPTGVVFRGHERPVRGAYYSPDGERVLTVSEDRTARIWDRHSGNPLGSITGHEWAVMCGAFSPDGSQVATGSVDTTARIWDVASGRELAQLVGHTAAITAIAFSPDGSRVMTGSQDNSVKLWDPRTGKEILSLAGHEQEVTSVDFSPNGQLALSSSRDGTAIVWLAVDWHDESSRSTAMGGRFRWTTRDP